MNCELFREQLSNAMATGETELHSGFAAHVSGCRGCNSFYEAETKLLRAIETSLSANVNQPVPPSLLPCVRERLDQLVSPLPRVHVLLPAAGVVAIAGLVVLCLLRFSTGGGDYPSGSFAHHLKENGKVQQAQAEIPRVLDARPSSGKKPSNGSSKMREAIARTEPAAPEILVDQDESRGLRLLASTVYREPEVGKALLHPASGPDSLAQPTTSEELVPVRVANLEIRPLTEMDR